MGEKKEENGRLNPRKKIIVLVGIFCVMMLGFVWSGILFMESRYAQNSLLALVNGKIPGHLSLEDLEIDIVAGQIDIAGLQVQGPDKRLLVRVEKLSLDLAWARLLKGEICLSSVRIASSEFDLSLVAGGSLDLVSAFVPPDPPDSAGSENVAAPSGLPLNILINEFVFTRGILSFSLPDNKVTLLVSGLDISILDFNLFNESARFKMGFETGKLTTQGRPIVVNSSQIEVSLGDGSLSGLVIQTGMDGVEMKIHGSVKDVMHSPFLDISMGAGVDLAQAVLLTGMAAPALKGDVLLDLSVKGTLENPGVKISVHSKEATVKAYALQNFKLNAGMKDWLLTLDPSGFSSKQGNLSLAGVINLGKAFPKGVKGALELDEISYDLNAVLEGVALSALPEAGLQTKGRLASRITVQGRGIDPEKIKADITAQLSATGLWVQGMPDSMDADFHADIGLDRFKAGIRSLKLTTPGIVMTGHGSVDIPAREISGHLDLEAADIGQLDRLTRVQGRGNIKVSAEIGGPFTGPTVSLSAVATALGINDILLGNLTLNAGLDRMGRILLDTFSLENQTSSLHGRGWANLFGQAVGGDSGKFIHLDLDLENLDPVHFMASSPLGGDFNGKIMLGGSLGKPVATVEIGGQDLSFNQKQGGNASVKLGFANGVLDVETFQLALGKSLIKGAGQARILDKNLALIKDPQIQLASAGASIFLEDFLPDIAGRLSLEGQVNGRLSNLAGHLTVDGASLGVGGQKIDGFSSKIRIQGQALEIDQMELQVSQGSVIRVKGQVIPMDQTFDILVDSQNFDLTCLNLFEKNGGDGGLLSLDLSARGGFKDPVVKGHLGIQKLVLLQKKQTPMDLWVELKNRRLGINGNLGLAVEGTYHLDTKAFTAALDMEGLNLSPYFNLLGQPRLTGAITGSIRAEGQADQLANTRAFAKFSKIEIVFEDKPFIRLADANLTIEKGLLHLPSVQIEVLETGRLRVKGDGNLNGDLDFEAQGEVPLSVINPLVEEIESATGLIRMTASLKGSLATPLVHGDFQFNGLGMAVEGIEQEFKNIDGHIQLTPDKIEILEFKGALDDGRFDLGGRVGLKTGAVKTIDLKFKAHQLNLEIPDLMDLNLNCDLNLAGTDQASALTGEVILVEGRYYKDVELNLIDTATQRTRKETLVEEKKPPGFLETIGLNVRVHRREPLLVDNNLAYLAISPDLTIQGTAATPLLSGRAQVDSGRIMFQRAEFEVKKGVVDFVNPYKIEPTIDIEGETEIRDWTITLAVSGTPDNLAFKFSSNPPEQHGDILSLIAFGKTTRELRAADGGGRFSAGEMLGGMVADSLGKSVQDATGLDYLAIDTQNKDGAGSGGVNVTVGADLSRQISVKYGVAVRNGETVQRVTSFYKLLENLLMSGYQDTGGSFGGELKYRLEFR